MRTGDAPMRFGDKMTGTIEELTFNERMERLKELAAAFVAVLSAATNHAMGLLDVLKAVAERLRIAVNQAKYGLTYARSQGLVVVSERNALVTLAA